MSPTSRPRVKHVSIHAPVRGATALALFVIYSIHVSIHAPVRGATEVTVRLGVEFVVSIHAPVRGATAATSSVLPFFFGFNPRPRAGGDGERIPVDYA